MDDNTPNTPSETSQAAEVTILSAREAADLLQIHHTTLYEAAKRGEIPCRRIGRRFIFERQSLVDWIKGPASAAEIG